MYAKIKNGVVEQYPFYIHTLKQENPNTSFPNNIEVDFESLAEFDVYRVFPTQQPEPVPMVSKVVEGTPALNQEGRYEQVWEVVPLTAAELEIAANNFKAEAVSKVQERLDAFARTRNYDSILSASTYATSSVPKFAQEGQYAVEARDATWAKMYEVMDEIQIGTLAMPTNFAEIEPLLPALMWPV